MLLAQGEIIYVLALLIPLSVVITHTLFTFGRFFRINSRPTKREGVILTTFPFIVFVVFYMLTAFERRIENEQDKLVPTVPELVDGFKRAAFEKDKDGEYRLLVDTIASTKRFAVSTALLFVGIIIGLHMGVLPYMESLLYRFVLFFDKIPALALLPILFIVFGLGEVSKIALVVIGVMPTIILDTYLHAKSVPGEQKIKGFTLGASDFEVIYRIVLPQIFPKALNTIRLNLRSVVLFLIAAEALAATAGLGYRIFLVRRYVAMDIIIPYVLYTSLLAFTLDLGIRIFNGKRYPWIDKE